MLGLTWPFFAQGFAGARQRGQACCRAVCRVYALLFRLLALLPAWGLATQFKLSVPFLAIGDHFFYQQPAIGQSLAAVRQVKPLFTAQQAIKNGRRCMPADKEAAL